MINTIRAFIRRDYLHWISYRVAILWQFLGMAAMIVVIYLVSGILGEGSTSFIERYDTNYLGFLMTNIILVDVWSVGFLLPQALRQNQAMGTLEAMMLSQVGVFRLVLYSSAYPIIIRLIRLLFYIFFGAVVLKLWGGVDLLAASAVFIAVLLTMVCMGVLSVAFILVLKQGDPILAVYGLLNGLVAGVFFPRYLLPEWIQSLSLLLPITHGLEGMWRALQGESLIQVLPHVVILLAMFLVLLPITIWALNWAVTRAKQEGSLVQY